MYKFPIGALCESFRLPTREAVKKAAELGLSGLQLYATRGENAPENLSGKNAADLLAFVKDNGLVFSALCGDLGRGFGHAELNPELIEQSKRILSLAKELECDIVTTHIGVVPEDPSHERYKIMQEACHQLAEFADSIDAHFAIETGPETSATLKKFLDSLGSKGVGVNLDPANLILYGMGNPVDALDVFGKYVRGVHGKDGKYPTSGRALGEETAMGEGKVDFPKLIKGLYDLGYDGCITIEREIEGDQQVKDVILARDMLQNIIANL